VTREEKILRQICNNYFDHTSFDELFIIDESIPATIVHSLHQMPVEKAATLDCWRDKIVAAIEEVALRYKNKQQCGCDDCVNSKKLIEQA
jgi:hypothetical protein